MSDQEEKTKLDNRAGPHETRTKDNPIGVDDIGLPSGIQPEETGKLQDIKPDPKRVDNKS
jgi:hypothetical protein